MKTIGKIVLISSVVLVVLLVLGFILSNKVLPTYSVNIDIEGVNSYPPRLTQIVERGETLDTSLSLLLPQIRWGKLSVLTPLTSVSGEITMVCEGYEETQSFSASSNNYGEELLSRHNFEKVPEGRCVIEANVNECETSIENGFCQFSRVTKTIQVGN